MSLRTHGDYAARVRASFARQAMMATLGITITRVAPGQVDLAMPFDAGLTQQHGFLHAGAVTTAMDSAAGYAAYSLMPEDAGVLTAEFKTTLLRPARGDRFTFEGRVVKPGRSLIFAEARTIAHTSAGPVEAARLSATLMVVTGRAEVTG